MSRNDAPVVRAAGGLLWRPSRRDGIKVALVHRPRYKDWSLPKGKAEPGETMPLTANREVAEETGYSCAVGRCLSTVNYKVGGGPKTVQYFSARAISGEFVPNKEVDRMEWLSPSTARRRMTYEFDRTVLAAFLSEPIALATVLLVRHARAGQRESWQGKDCERPLDAKGTRQSEALVGELLPFDPCAVHSAPVRRCIDTVRPLADKLSLRIREEPAFEEERYRDDPGAARKRLVELAMSASRLAADRPGSNGAMVASSQGGVIPGVLKTLATRSDLSLKSVGTPKAAYWVLTFDEKRLVQADAYPPPAV